MQSPGTAEYSAKPSVTTTSMAEASSPTGTFCGISWTRRTRKLQHGSMPCARLTRSSQAGRGLLAALAPARPVRARLLSAPGISEEICEGGAEGGR